MTCWRGMGFTDAILSGDRCDGIFCKELNSFLIFILHQKSPVFDRSLNG